MGVGVANDVHIALQDWVLRASAMLLYRINPMNDGVIRRVLRKNNKKRRSAKKALTSEGAPLARACKIM